MTNLKQKLNNELSDELSNDVSGEDDFVQDAVAPEQLVQVETVSTPEAPEANSETPQNAAGAAAEVQEDFQPLHLRRRLRELLSVPERDRNDAQWDEIIELEIQLAPGNRVAGHDVGGGNARQHAPRSNKPGGSSGQHGGQQGGGVNAGGAGAQQKKHRPRSKNNRRPRPGGGKGGGEVAG